MCVMCETKDVNAKVFYIIKKINEVKAFVKHFFCDCKCRFDKIKYVIQIKNGVMKNVIVSGKDNVQAKMIIVGILTHVFVRAVGI